MEVAAGHTVTYTPPYHSDMQPIEIVWAIVKCQDAFEDLKASSFNRCLHKSDSQLYKLEEYIKQKQDEDARGNVSDSDSEMTRVMYPISLKLEALGLLEFMSDYKVAEKLGIPRRTIRNWTKQRFELLAYEGNKKRMKIEPGRRREAFPDPPGLVDFINQLRDAERALTMLHLITWINQREWLLAYLATKQPGNGYKSVHQLL
ncbi:hypothetical protein DYB34_008631 [Aphanomyces astaci]|uniref:Tc1-like transposase DDE domain-containing protein n=1 Tax=Aphanomyces astaci TaxID=112090 RepID=A0A3R6YTY9_APHAT|nr:hypothetical protein DYB34_008631 [Aphanomyces astaci]